MKCCEQYAAALSAFMDGELSENEKEEVLSHVEHCQNCREYLSELMIVHTMFEEMPELDAPEGFSAWQSRTDSDLASFAEAGSTGAGAVPRGVWVKQLDSVQAAQLLKTARGICRPE